MHARTHARTPDKPPDVVAQQLRQEKAKAQRFEAEKIRFQAQLESTSHQVQALHADQSKADGSVRTQAASIYINNHTSPIRRRPPTPLQRARTTHAHAHKHAAHELLFVRARVFAHAPAPTRSPTCLLCARTRSRRLLSCAAVGNHHVVEWLKTVEGWPPLAIAAGCRMHQHSSMMLLNGRADPGLRLGNRRKLMDIARCPWLSSPAPPRPPSLTGNHFNAEGRKQAAYRWQSAGRGRVQQGPRSGRSAAA